SLLFACSSSMIPPPPRSTLFPYTTLFRSGEKIVEVKPVWANKGEVLDRLLALYPDPDFIFAAGDDRTDEDLFERSLNGARTVHIGLGPTHASYVVPDFEELRTVLGSFASPEDTRKAS